jgi:hypothetical protein
VHARCHVNVCSAERVLINVAGHICVRVRMVSYMATHARTTCNRVSVLRGQISVKKII